MIARFCLSFLAKFGGSPKSEPYQRSNTITLLEKPDLDDPLNGWQVDFWSQELAYISTWLEPCMYIYII